MKYLCSKAKNTKAEGVYNTEVHMSEVFLINPNGKPVTCFAESHSLLNQFAGSDVREIRGESAGAGTNPFIWNKVEVVPAELGLTRP